MILRATTAAGASAMALNLLCRRPMRLLLASWTSLLAAALFPSVAIAAGESASPPQPSEQPMPQPMSQCNSVSGAAHPPPSWSELARCADEHTRAIAEVWDRPWALEVDVGLGTPVGYGGIRLARALGRYFALDIGGGLSAHDGVAPQLETMGHLRLPMGKRSAIDLGFGVSAGRYQWSEITWGDGRPAVKTWPIAVWGNAELGYESRWASGLLVRPFVGYAAVLNRSAGTCSAGDNGDVAHCLSGHRGDGFWAPYLGVGIGSTFE